jgi:hypothetical protein
MFTALETGLFAGSKLTDELMIRLDFMGNHPLIR